MNEQKEEQEQEQENENENENQISLLEKWQKQKFNPRKNWNKRNFCYFRISSLCNFCIF